MLVKFKGRNWTLERARAQLQIYLNILGFGKGGSKKYKSEADEPEGWPDFLHPSYAKLGTINDIIASLLQFHGYDVQHHTIDDEEDGEEDVVPPKRRKVCHNLETPNVVRSLTQMIRMGTWSKKDLETKIFQMWMRMQPLI